ncbi:hypothetical protein F0562_018148 [Nyssa sinensis]|uniref:Chromo domain-containing protein n=1 Tax=Nyssa sinensis TaxID=561372 RepID=A0A5J4Z960_9ASTE|nr:hypothetical protein F0562_018148 [Nyssa sinensis]
MNKWLEGYLRCFTSDRPKDWASWLALAEWTYNTSEHSSTGFTPFEMVYGQEPPRLLPYKPRTTAVQAVEDEMRSRDFILTLMMAAMRKSLKLSPRYFEPFQIIQKIGKVAYKLDLPKESKIYPVFHISCLKKKIGTQVNPNPRLPTVMENGAMAPKPEKILERRLKKKGNRTGIDFLIKWKGANKEDATWVDAEELHRTYPELVGEFF